MKYMLGFISNIKTTTFELLVLYPVQNPLLYYTQVRLYTHLGANLAASLRAGWELTGDVVRCATKCGRSPPGHLEGCGTVGEQPGVH